VLPLLVAFAALAGPQAAQGASRGSPPDTAQDSVYATPALRALAERVSARNATVPRGLGSYRVTIESEMSVLLRSPDGREGATQVEQTESVARWRRTGAFTQRVVGYRSRLSGFDISALSLIKQAWAVPVLYGNRLGLFLGSDTTRRARRAAARRDTSVRVVHPFARDRDQVYRYTGGDTAVTIRVNGQVIPVARIHVTPRRHLPRRVVVFEGDVDVAGIPTEATGTV